MLHWIVSSCTSMPVYHFLGNFFDTVPPQPSKEPVHSLALTCKALGFMLAEEKTFHRKTCLEILGIEIDTVHQTVGITDQHHTHILAICSSLLAQPHVTLLQL